MKLLNLLNKIQQPFISIDYYKKAINKSFLSSFGILSIVILVMSFTVGSKFTKNQVPKFITTTQNIVSEISQNYPNDLTFNWNGKQLTSNVEKLSVPWPSMFDNSFSDTYPEVQKVPNQFLYFYGSNQNPNELNISTQEYLILVNSTNLYHINDQNPDLWITQSLEKTLTLDVININKSYITTLDNQVTNFLNSNINAIKILFFTIFSMLFYFSKLWFLIIETLLVILLFKLYSIKLTAKQTVILTTHVMIPTVVLNTLAELIYTTSLIPLQTLTFWILIVFISFEFRKRKVGKK